MANLFCPDWPAKFEIGDRVEYGGVINTCINLETLEQGIVDTREQTVVTALLGEEYLEVLNSAGEKELIHAEVPETRNGEPVPVPHCYNKGWGDCLHSCKQESDLKGFFKTRKQVKS